MKKSSNIASYFKFVSSGEISVCKGMSRKRRKQVALSLQHWDTLLQAKGLSPTLPPVYIGGVRVNLQGVTTGRWSAC